MAARTAVECAGHAPSSWPRRRGAVLRVVSGNCAGRDANTVHPYRQGRHDPQTVDAAVAVGNAAPEALDPLMERTRRETESRVMPANPRRRFFALTLGPVEAAARVSASPLLHAIAAGLDEPVFPTTGRRCADGGKSPASACSPISGCRYGAIDSRRAGPHTAVGAGSRCAVELGLFHMDAPIARSAPLAVAIVRYRSSYFFPAAMPCLRPRSTARCRSGNISRAYALSIALRRPRRPQSVTTRSVRRARRSLGFYLSSAYQGFGGYTGVIRLLCAGVLR